MLSEALSIVDGLKWDNLSPLPSYFVLKYAIWKVQEQ
jgi:hypothetical protein